MSKLYLVHGAPHQTRTTVADVLHNKFTRCSLQSAAILLDKIEVWDQHSNCEPSGTSVVEVEAHIAGYRYTYRRNSCLATLPGLKNDDWCLSNRTWNLVRVNFGWGRDLGSSMGWVWHVGCGRYPLAYIGQHATVHDRHSHGWLHTTRHGSLKVEQDQLKGVKLKLWQYKKETFRHPIHKRNPNER